MQADNSYYLESGGRGGIRTPDRLSPMPVFKTGAFNHSATRPQKRHVTGCAKRRISGFV